MDREVDGRTDGPRSWLTYGEFEELRNHTELFSGLMASQSSLGSWQVRFDAGAWEEARGRLVSDEFFDVLGVSAAIGRMFTATDNCAATPCAVISHSYWQRRFGGRFDVLGKTLTIRTAGLTIIGVAPAGFIGETMGQRPDLWLPLRAQPSVLPGSDRLHDTPPEKIMWLHVFGRLKPGVALAQADAQANVIFQAGLESFYGAAASGDRRREFLGQRLQIQPAARGASSKRSDLSHSLTALLAGVGVLLLIACANLSNLLLARGAARKTEIALRVSLGASRERIVRQLFTESLTLAAMGGVAAIAVAYVLHGALVRMLAESDPRFHMTFALDPPMLAFVLAVTFAAALLFGILPAWQITKTDAGSLQGQSRGAIGSLRQTRSGRLLVSLQLALSLPLLVGAGLLARTVHNLQRADLGFPSTRVVLARVDARDAGYDGTRLDTLLRELREQVQRIPGVRAASFSQLGVFSGGESSNSIEVEGYTPKGDRDRGSTRDAVGAGYFSTLGIPVTLGRDIQDTDNTEAPRVCVINEAFAKQFFGGRNPIGMHVTVVGDGDEPRTTFQVVGVTKNAHTQNLRGEVKPRFFTPGRQTSGQMKSPFFLIRTASDTAAVAGTVRKAIQQVDSSLPILSISSIENEMAELTAQDRFTAQLAVVCGFVALLLAVIGLYGVLSYGVARRTGEIAIRIALGARPGRVVSMILRETSALVGLGLALGGGLAYAASRVIDSRLYGVAPQDPLTLTLATGVLLLVALSAAYLPARRASRLDPLAALRHA